MIKKYVYLSVILILLIGSCIVEEILVNNYLSEIDNLVSNIQTVVTGRDDLNTNEIYFLVENLDESWKKKEEILCLLVNHKDIEDIGLEIARLKSNVATNQIEDFNASLSLIRFYTDTYHHVMGTNIYNLL